MKKQKNNKAIILILFMLFSCTSNVFTIEEGCITSKDKPIKYLEIQSEDGVLHYSIENKNSKITSICLYNIPTEYNITKYEEVNGFIKYKKVKSIVLEKNQYYNFKISGGDSGAYNLRVMW